MTKLIHGVGVNDADYQVTKYSDGKLIWICPFYEKWKDMISRCYSQKRKKTHPTYKDVTVHNDWLTFSRFKLWMQYQKWQDKYLDKDIIDKGSKEYSPSTCSFVDRKTNNFVTDRGALRGDLMIGVSHHKASGQLQSRCRNPFTNKSEYLGLFDNELEAHSKWKERKHQLALELADMQEDERVAKALRIRYL